LLKGGVLTLQMGDRPNKTWGSKPENAPPSAINVNPENYK